MDEYIPLLLTFFLSLLVALASIRYERRLKDNEERMEILNSLQHEAWYNRRMATAMLERIDECLRFVKKGEDLAPLPLFSDSAYIAARNKGTVVKEILKEIRKHPKSKEPTERKWSDLNDKLNNCYFILHIINSAINMREQVKLLTLPLEQDLREKYESSAHVRTITLKYLRGEVAKAIPLLDDTSKIVTDFIVNLELKLSVN
jgi:DNA-directed RNA polymerase subunit N (RpoN/RPB10)